MGYSFCWNMIHQGINIIDFMKKDQNCFNSCFKISVSCELPIRSSPFIIPTRRGGTLLSGGSAALLSRIEEGLLLSVKRVQLVITRKALPHFIHLNFLC